MIDKMAPKIARKFPFVSPVLGRYWYANLLEIGLIFEPSGSAVAV